MVMVGRVAHEWIAPIVPFGLIDETCGEFEPASRAVLDHRSPVDDRSLLDCDGPRNEPVRQHSDIVSRSLPFDGGWWRWC